MANLGLRFGIVAYENMKASTVQVFLTDWWHILKQESLCFLLNIFSSFWHGGLWTLVKDVLCKFNQTVGQTSFRLSTLS